MQDALQEKNDILLKAVTGLQGGCVANGSTCGIATGGALGIALKFEPYLQERNAQTEALLLESVGYYMDWFRENHGTTECRERNNVDFQKTTGQLQYFLSARKILRCVHMAGKSLQHLNNINGDYPPPGTADMIKNDQSCSPVHCAEEVLKQVRKKTGIGNKQLERLSIVFDGGVGLKGVLCGALSGAILSINLLHGFNLRQMSYASNIKKFLIGHINLIRTKPGKRVDTFSIGKQMVNTFREHAGSIECSSITGRQFKDIHDFKGYIENSETCHNLINISADIAVKAIQETR